MPQLPGDGTGRQLEVQWVRRLGMGPAQHDLAPGLIALAMSGNPLVPAEIEISAGVPYAPRYGDVYHSSDGGLAQSRHVFLAGNGLPQRWRGRHRFAILETGFGLGLNFLCTAAELLSDRSSPARLHYVGIEKHPPLRVDLERVHALWPELTAYAEELRERWPPLVPGFHRIELARGRIALTLALGDVEPMLSELAPQCIDAVYLDGFAPDKNAQMWAAPVYRQIARIARPNATAATWSVSARVRAGLEAAGFRIDKRAGFGRKREMLVAERGATAAEPAHSPSRHAVIIGAGVAGCWMAHALARRGWHIELVEAHEQPAMEASGNAVAALLPALNLADNENARLARAAFLYSAQALRTLSASGDIWRQTGLLQIAATPQQEERMQRILSVHALPSDYVRWVGTREAGVLAAQRVAGPGWWIPGGGWLAPDRLCRALLAASNTRLITRFGRRAQRIEGVADDWRVLDGNATVLAQAPTVVLANAFGANALGGANVPPLVTVRGQITYLPPSSTRRLAIVVCGDGYVAPLPDGGDCVGATFEPESSALDLREADHVRNLARLARMLPGYAEGLDPCRLSGRAGLRTATRDRLPLCGPLAEVGENTRADGRYLLAGLGARGMIWAPLCAEHIACELDAEPRPIEASLGAALSPHRWARAARKK